MNDRLRIKLSARFCLQTASLISLKQKIILSRCRTETRYFFLELASPTASSLRCSRRVLLNLVESDFLSFLARPASTYTRSTRPDRLMLCCCFLFIFNDSFQTNYLNIYRTDLCRIYRTTAAANQSANIFNLRPLRDVVVETNFWWLALSRELSSNTCGYDLNLAEAWLLAPPLFISCI